MTTINSAVMGTIEGATRVKVRPTVCGKGRGQADFSFATDVWEDNVVLHEGTDLGLLICVEWMVRCRVPTIREARESDVVRQTKFLAIPVLRCRYSVL